MERDLRNKISLESLGWRVMVVWECELGVHDLLKERMRDFLQGPLGNPGTDGMFPEPLVSNELSVSRTHSQPFA